VVALGVGLGEASADAPGPADEAPGPGATDEVVDAAPGSTGVEHADIASVSTTASAGAARIPGARLPRRTVMPRG
jgi:hypothetical protein